MKTRADPKFMLVGGDELAGAAPAEAERIGEVRSTGRR